MDSESVAVGEKALVEYALRLKDQGANIDTIVEILEREKKQLCVLGLLDTLEYLQKGGRISKTVAIAGSLLSIKPVVTVTDGEVQLLGKARGSKQGNNFLIQKIQERGVDFQLCVLGLLDTLEYLQKGGRISKTVAIAGSLLSIKPVVTVTDGEVQLLGKARGSKQGNNFLIQKIQERGVDFSRPIALGYTGLSDVLLQKYIEDSRSLWEGHADSLSLRRQPLPLGRSC